MKTCLKILFIATILAMLSFLNHAYAEIEIGSTKEEVISAYGKPSGTITSNEEEIFSYPAGCITIKNNKVINIDKSFKENINIAKQKPAIPAASQASGQPKQEVPLKSPAKTSEPIKIYAQGGKEIDLKTVLEPGKVTIVDFYADWCGPCRAIAPHLERIVASDPDVVLRKIDIVNWNTPVVKQYKIQSVPNIRVFNRKGVMIGSPTYNLNQVQEYIKKAK